MEQLLIAHDLGTSGDKATLFTTKGRQIRSFTVPYDVHFFNGNYAEQDPENWWDAVCDATKAVLEGEDPSKVAAMSFSAQMQGCLVVDKNGVPLRDAIIWAAVMPIIFSIFLPFASNGSALGGIMPLILYPLITIVISYYLIHNGYTLGKKSIVSLLHGGRMKNYFYGQCHRTYHDGRPVCKLHYFKYTAAVQLLRRKHHRHSGGSGPDRSRSSPPVCRIHHLRLPEEEGTALHQDSFNCCNCINYHILTGNLLMEREEVNGKYLW